MGEQDREPEVAIQKAGWKPKLATVSIEDRPVNSRPWIAVAEAHAESAVKLFVQVMNDPKQGVKARLEAATKIAQLAGATYRGERKDGTGRPAANHHVGEGALQGRTHAELRSVLSAQLPPGSVKASPAEIKKDEKVVILHDTEHTRKPTGHIKQDSVGKLVMREEDIPTYGLNKHKRK